MQNIIEKIQQGEVSKSAIFQDNAFSKKYNIPDSQKVIICSNRGGVFYFENKLIADFKEFKKLAKRAKKVVIIKTYE